MKLMEILKKLGIVRCESKAGVYTSGKDRPLDFIDEIDTEQGPSTSNDTATSPSE
jgi:hypothetical protein